MSSGVDLTWSSSGHNGIRPTLSWNPLSCPHPFPRSSPDNGKPVRKPAAYDTEPLQTAQQAPGKLIMPSHGGGGLAPRGAFSHCPVLPAPPWGDLPIPRRCLWGPFEPRNTLLGKHVPEINSILASSQKQEHSRAVSMTEGQMQPGLSWTQQPWTVTEPTLLRVHRLLQQGVQGG